MGRSFEGISSKLSLNDRFQVYAYRGWITVSLRLQYAVLGERYFELGTSRKRLRVNPKLGRVSQIARLGTEFMEQALTENHTTRPILFDGQKRLHDFWTVDSRLTTMVVDGSTNFAIV